MIQSTAETTEAAPDVEMPQATQPATNSLRPQAIPVRQWNTMQELRTNPDKFCGEVKEKEVQELIEEVFLGYDKTKGASYLIWQLVSALEDIPNGWNWTGSPSAA